MPINARYLGKSGKYFKICCKFKIKSFRKIAFATFLVLILFKLLHLLRF